MVFLAVTNLTVNLIVLFVTVGKFIKNKIV